MKSLHIGSLPHSNIKDAIKYCDNFSIPTMPSLPMLSEREFMLNQAVDKLNNVFILDNKIHFNNEELNSTEISFLCEKAFIDKYQGKICKWQFLGPVTFLFSCVGLSREFEEKLLSWHAQRIVNYHKFLTSKFETVLFFLDEPILEYVSNEKIELLDKFCSDLAKEIDQLGVHCCSNFNFNKLHNKLSYISLDYNIVDSSHLPKNSDINLVLGIGSETEINDHKLSTAFAISPPCGLALSSPDELDLVAERMGK